jgi:chromosome segregation ATPase
MNQNKPMNIPTTETRSKYEENLNFNLESAKARRIEITQYIKQTEEEISQTDGRKKSLIETLNRRIVNAKTNLKQIEDKIHELDSLGVHVEEIANLDDEISRLCKKRDELTNKSPILHGYLKSKSYGFI